MKNKINIFWFRRDLRLDDNNGLYHALNGNHPVLPIFIFDTEILEKLPEDDARVSFIHQKIQELRQDLKKVDGSLAIYHGKPLEIFKELTAQFEILEVHTNRDYEPYARERDSAVNKFLSEKNIEFTTYKDQVIFEQDEILKKDGDPYVVYTPYMKLWKQQFKSGKLENYNSASLDRNFYRFHGEEEVSLEELGFKKTSVEFPEYDLSAGLLEGYKNKRDFPALHATSRVGAYLRFGVVSIRKVVKKAAEAKDETFLQELIWREFFMQILYHFPMTVTNAFKPKYDRIQWRNDEKEFELWKDGKTGYPLVDAGMRQMNQTGFMHNRVRMLVASFLCKHLLIDWRWGEAYFAEKLLDYEMASNVGNWQWAAGSGVDAAPYFRIFNPTTQIEKFDRNKLYIKEWVEEFGTPSYPGEMVDHKEARERALEVYKEALSG